MKKLQVGIVAALILFIVFDEAKAQQYSSAGLVAGSYVNGANSGGTVVNPTAVAGGLVSRPSISGEVLTAMPAATPAASAVSTFPAQGQVFPYSYWASAPQPARVYVEYGASDQFRFQGRAYGSPSDRWSWYYMGGGDSRYLARYYYRPLR